jgi:hypothetical protein
MSLFDALRYVVSYPPLSEELLVLPRDLLSRWAKETNWQIGPALISTYSETEYIILITNLCNYYASYKNEDSQSDKHKIARHKEEISILRRLIKEYDSD